MPVPCHVAVHTTFTFDATVSLTSAFAVRQNALCGTCREHSESDSTVSSYSCAMFKELFVNLPVADVSMSADFFTQLGLTPVAQYTSADSACFTLTDNVRLMLSGREKLAAMIGKQLATPDTSEVALSFACDSAEMVQKLATKAFELGARKVNDFEDEDFMVSWGFEDLDGHLWDLFWLKPQDA